MRTSEVVRPLAVLVVLLSFSVFGTPIATENFESYPTGELNGQNGGTGWGGAWTAVPAATQVVAPGVPLEGTKALQVTGNNNNVAYRPLASAISDTEVFFSFLLRVEAGTINNNDFLGLWFDNSATGIHSTVPNVGYKGNRGGGSGPEDIFGRISLTASQGGEVYAAETAVGETHLVVGRLYKDGSVNYNRLQVWVDPASQASASVTAGAGGGAISSFSLIGFRSANLDAGDELLVDNLRLGTAFEDVAAGDGGIVIPEPSTVVLLGSALLGIGFIRRRRPA